MRLENILALTHGKLINTPFVEQFENIVFDAKAVRRGDLFVADDETMIQEAVMNGAYGILFDKPTQIQDSEIAWIKVDNLDEALIRVLRFTLIQKPITVFECDTITLKLAKQIMTESSFIVLDDDIRSLFKRLSLIESPTTLLFTPSLTPRDLFTTLQQMPTVAKERIEIVEKTLFETSFLYANLFYERQQIAPFFIPYLERLLTLLVDLKVRFHLRKFLPLDHFAPLFVNKKLEEKEFGSSDRVLIFEPQCTIVPDEIHFLETEAPWAQKCYFLPNTAASQSLLKSEKLQIEFYNDTAHLVQMLQERSFHFALIGGSDKTLLHNHIQSTKESPSLFDF